MFSNVLIKHKNTKTQSLLNLEERKNNLKGCFKVMNKDLLENKKVFLVDDIYTTGTTVKECVLQLNKGKPKEINIFVVAR